MVDLSGGQDGPIEHGFSNTVFIIPGIIFITLSGVQDMDEELVMDQGVGDDSQVPDLENMPTPSLEELLKALDGMTGMSEEDKQQLRESIMNPASMGLNQPGGFQSSSQFIVLICMLLVVGLIFVFFGYKLYKSLADKERKRDEKRKMKQMKKKK